MPLRAQFSEFSPFFPPPPFSRQVTTPPPASSPSGRTTPTFGPFIFLHSPKKLNFSRKMPALRPVRRFQLAIRRSRPEPISGTRCSPRSRRVLMDAYRLGNRQTFNAAFKKLGLNCASWAEPVYLDLLRESAGDEEKMVNLYFNRIGWPSALPTNEKESFVKNVLQKKKMAMDEFLMSENLTLRPGVEEFIDDAYKEGIPVVVLTTYSKNGDQIARSIVEKLGEERISKLKIVGDKKVEQSLYTQLVNDTGLSSGVDEQLAKEAIKAVSAEKQRIAEEVASMLKLSVDIDTSPSESLEMIIAALRAGTEVAGLPVCDCVLIAGSQSGVAGAERVGMPCVVLRSSLTTRAPFGKCDNGWVWRSGPDHP